MWTRAASYAQRPGYAVFNNQLSTQTHIVLPYILYMPPESAPPIYSQEDPEDSLIAEDTNTALLIPEPHILIIPADANNFQKGYVGAEGERAAIEGELQIKGGRPGQWDKVFVFMQVN